MYLVALFESKDAISHIKKQGNRIKVEISVYINDVEVRKSVEEKKLKRRNRLAYRNRA